MPVPILHSKFDYLSYFTLRTFPRPVEISQLITKLRDFDNFKATTKNKQTKGNKAIKTVDNKQLLDEVFVICTIIKVLVRVISQSRRLRLITLTKTFNILIIVLLHIEQRKWKPCFCFFTDRKQHKACEGDMITRDFEFP